MKALSLMVSYKRIFLRFFPIKAYVKHVTPGAGHFWPQGYHWNKLGIGLLGDALYQNQGSRHFGFRQEYFFHVSPYISICKTCDPGEGSFFASGHNLNKLRRGLLGDAAYKLSRL